MVIYNGVHYDALAMAASPRAAETHPACLRLLLVVSGANHYTGYTKQVMVIYNGVHYDALAIAASPRADQDEDATEYNPRTRRGKMILAAAQQLVCPALASDKCPFSLFWHCRRCIHAHAADAFKRGAVGLVFLCSSYLLVKPAPKESSTGLAGTC
jgi:hypothetical protein